jgi:hypothetical protein
VIKVGGVNEAQPESLGVHPLLAALKVSALLALIPLGFYVVYGPPVTQGWTDVGLVEWLSRILAQVLPFGAFAAGLAASQFGRRAREARRSRFAIALGLGLATYLLSAWAVPLLEYAVDVDRGADVEALHPFGPKTAVGLLRQREYVRLNPSEQFSFSVNEPFSIPPEWLGFLLHSSIAYSFFATLNAMAGYLVGLLTSSLPGRRRRLVRWASGLVGGIAFIAAVVIAAGWQRANPEMSGALMAWVPLLIPALECWLLYVFVRRSGLRLHDDEPGHV